ncbi:ubiquitin-protein ligase peroxin 12 [Taxawa tesnikishii (nom. ined.)]|nr:ubiquitin-protein ligase peroxin 12 [Dothideales sp. JES 119]
MEFMTSLQSGHDEQKPSLFELLSESQLASLIPPSLRYLLALATHRQPRYLLRVLNSFDELYALLSLLVERHYLVTYSGGFTENFYGLKRERVLRTKNGEIPRAALGAPEQVRETLKLRTSDVWKNLAVMVALPYVKRKLDEGYDVHAAGSNLLGPAYADRDQLPRDAGIKQRLLWYYKWFLRKVYPSVNAAYYFALLAFNLAYLFDGSKYHSPFLWLIGTRMRRLNEADHRAIAAAAQTKPSRGARPGQTNSIFSPRTFTHTVYPRVLSSLRILLPTSIFALKFLEWWHASDFARQLSRKAAEGLELPPPTVSGLPAPAEKPSERVLRRKPRGNKRAKRKNPP